MNIEILEGILKKKLKKYEKVFGLVCLFGSLNFREDLDIFVSPSKNVKKGYFLKQLVFYLDEIRKELEKNGLGLLVVTYSVFEDEVKYINTKKDCAILHISSLRDISPIPIYKLYIKKEKIKKILLGNYKAIGDKKTNLDYYYNYLFTSNCLFSNYPKSLERRKITDKVNYIYKNLTGKKRELNGSTKKIYFDCCDFLDGIGK